MAATMNPYKEIADLKQYIANLEKRIAAKDADMRQAQAKLLQAQQRIESLEAQIKFFRDVANDSLEDAHYWRDRAQNNPYSNDFYNES